MSNKENQPVKQSTKMINEPLSLKDDVEDLDKSKKPHSPGAQEDHTFSMNSIMWEDTDYNPPTDAVYPSTNPYIAYEQQRI